MGFNKPLGQAFLVILLAIASYQLLHENSHNNPAKITSEKDQTEKPTAFILNGKFTIYDKNGHATDLYSKKARYFSDPKRILIDSPAITFKTTDNQTVTLNANTGVFHPEDERLLLRGKVVIQRGTHQLSDTPDKNAHLSSEISNNIEAWTLESEEFELNNKTHFISTDQAVTMTKGKSSIRAIGLNAWIDEKRIELLSEVQGHYVFNE